MALTVDTDPECSALEDASSTPFLEESAAELDHSPPPRHTGSGMHRVARVVATAGAVTAVLLLGVFGGHESHFHRGARAVSLVLIPGQAASQASPTRYTFTLHYLSINDRFLDYGRCAHHPLCLQGTKPVKGLPTARWRIVTSPGGLYELQTADGEYCLSNSGAFSKCEDAGSASDFKLIRRKDFFENVYQIKSAETGKCLEQKGLAYSTCDVVSLSQLWRIEGVQDGAEVDFASPDPQHVFESESLRWATACDDIGHETVVAVQEIFTGTGSLRHSPVRSRQVKLRTSGGHLAVTYMTDPSKNEQGSPSTVSCRVVSGEDEVQATENVTEVVDPTAKHNCLLGATFSQTTVVKGRSLTLEMLKNGVKDFLPYYKQGRLPDYPAWAFHFMTGCYPGGLDMMSMLKDIMLWNAGLSGALLVCCCLGGCVGANFIKPGCCTSIAGMAVGCPLGCLCVWLIVVKLSVGNPFMNSDAYLHHGGLM